MAKFTWSSDLETGDQNVDYQHKKIVNYINLLETTLKTKEAPQSLLKNIIFGIIDYAEFHFTDEEVILTTIDYPHLQMHQKAHTDFVEQIQKLKSRFENNEDIRRDLHLLLTEWFKSHINQEDKRAFAFIKTAKG